MVQSSQGIQLPWHQGALTPGEDLLLFPMLQRLLCHLVLLMGAERDSVQLQATQLLSGRQGSGPRPGLAGWYAPLQSPSAEAAEAEDEAWC